jgi:hypothetical protein
LAVTATRHLSGIPQWNFNLEIYRRISKKEAENRKESKYFLVINKYLLLAVPLLSLLSLPAESNKSANKYPEKSVKSLSKPQ